MNVVYCDVLNTNKPISIAQREREREKMSSCHFEKKMKVPIRMKRKYVSLG